MAKIVMILKRRMRPPDYGFGEWTLTEEPLMQKVEPQAKALSLFAHLLGGVMPFWYGGCLLLLAAETWLHHGSAAYPFVADSDCAVACCDRFHDCRIGSNQQSDRCALRC
jgi:hypothetical protein